MKKIHLFNLKNQKKNYIAFALLGIQSAALGYYDLMVYGPCGLFVCTSILSNFLFFTILNLIIAFYLYLIIKAVSLFFKSKIQNILPKIIYVAMIISTLMIINRTVFDIAFEMLLSPFMGLFIYGIQYLK